MTVEDSVHTGKSPSTLSSVKEQGKGTLSFISYFFLLPISEPCYLSAQNYLLYLSWCLQKIVNIHLVHISLRQ